LHRTTHTRRLVASLAVTVGLSQAQVPADIEAQLMKIGQIVDPACTAKLYRPLMPKNDFNTYWPPDASAPVSKAALYPGITITRDQSFGPDTKDVLDIFVADKGGGNRPVLIYVPGGGGNKIEQQVRESNAFYDNIGRWATKNGMVGILVQRHPGTKWDDGGRDISLAVDWLHDNIAKYKGDPIRMIIWAHSAGNGPLGQYIGHADRWKNGVQVKGAIFMSGNPVPTVGAAAEVAGRGNPQAANTPGRACGVDANMGSNGGKISGPSGQAATAAFGLGAGGGRGPGRAQLTPEERAEGDNLPGFKSSKVKIMFSYAELDPGVTDAKMPSNIQMLHDELCKLGADHCPTMFVSKGESHMSEVFSIDTNDKNVSSPVLAWVKKVK
jgi:pimeloyl-ACP methyl ester carboxylesterase